MMKDTVIGVVGAGVVGAATAKAWTGYAKEVRVHDARPERATHTLDQVVAADVIFVCLPTPQKAGSLECDTSALNCFFEGLGDGSRSANFVIKSTVPVGFTKATWMLCPNVIHSPEFLTAATAEFDACYPVRNVVGLPYSAPNWETVPLARLYRERWPDVPIHLLFCNDSEAVKLFQNAFSAVKIAVMNEFRAYCVTKAMDWNAVREALLAGGWINRMHTQVPGPDGKRGFGPDTPNACLPKDIANLAHCMMEADQFPFMLRAAMERNKRDRSNS